MSPTPRPRFRITGSGQLERSVEPNMWTPAPVGRDVHLRVVAVFGDDVWAGGDRLRLFHSSDNGLTWTEVRLPASADGDRALVHIRVDDGQHLTVEDDAGSVWSSVDGGRTWK